MSIDNYNFKRKRILEKLDKGEKVPIIELGMYDLTPYFDNESFDVNLSESIMLYKNSERKIQHISDRELFFSPPQFNALSFLFANNRVVLSAPTSFGKTLLIKEYIFLKKPQKVIYIVPTNALSYELESSFKSNQNFSDYIIFDKSIACERINNELKNKEKYIFIGTQEKFLEIDNEFVKDIDLFVIDEAYKLQESIKNQRAYKLSESFLDSVSLNAKKIFLLTPKAKFHGFGKYQFKKFETDFNAVEKNYIIVNKNDFYSEFLKKGKSEKTIMFCGNPEQISNVYSSIQLNLNNQKNSKFITSLETEIHPDWDVIKLLKSGILTHHGQMPKFVQNKMIDLFNNSKDYNILLGTNSISEGINTVTKNLFIHPDNSKITDTLLLKNTIGRAGRLGEYPIGYIFSTTKIDDCVEKEIDICLAIAKDEELSEIEDSKNDEKIEIFSEHHNLDFDFCKELLNTYKLSLLKLGKILDSLKIDRRYSSITNLPFIASKAFGDYPGKLDYDKVLIKGFLQKYVLENDEKFYINSFNDRVEYFKKHKDLDNTYIINLYMQFIYSTMEYYIMPIINIAIDIKEKNPNWSFGKNVLKSIEDCKNKYYTNIYGNLNFDNLSESHKMIINSLKDYGMTSIIKNLDEKKLDEIESCLKLRYSTIDIINAIKKLAEKSNDHFFANIVNKYFI